MNKLLVLAFSIILAASVVSYGLFVSRPNEGEVTARIPPIPAVDPNLLSNPTVQKIKQFEVNGAVPVEVPASELGRDDPFAGF